VTSEDLQNAMPPQAPRSSARKKAGRTGRKSGSRTVKKRATAAPTGRTWPRFLLPPRTPGCPQERAIAAARVRQGERRRHWKAIE
jgi:hypothetical protein